MIGVSKLYCNVVEPSDVLRYGCNSAKLPSHLLQFSSDKKPVVVWNITQRCNLRCVHCYSRSENIEYGDELTTAEGMDLIDDLARFGVPVILFSGGEPLMRRDFPELANHAMESGMRVVLSTNGTLITKEMAKVLKEIDLSYVGVSLDGMRETNDRFRGVNGAFDSALKGIQNCKMEKIKVGLRFTINKKNANDIPSIFDLLKRENIPRVCFYHLVYAGRGSKLVKEDLSHEESRKTLNLIMNRTRALHESGFPIESLTVDNHCDGIYIYMHLLKEDPERAKEVYELLQMYRGNSSGIGIACVSWDGSVHADQFWRHYSFGNVRERKFSEIWTDTSDEVMAGLKNRKPLIKTHGDKCARCKWFDLCNGNLRVRAEAVHNDIWADDPACYLTNEEIGY